MRVAGRENAIGHWETRRGFERREQIGCRLVEPATKELGLANSRQISCKAITRAEAQVGLEMLECEIGLTGKKPEQGATNRKCQRVTGGVCQLSDIPALRKPAKYVVSHKAWIFGTPKSSRTLNPAMLEYRLLLSSRRASASSEAARSVSPFKA